MRITCMYAWRFTLDLNRSRLQRYGKASTQEPGPQNDSYSEETEWIFLFIDDNVGEIVSVDKLLYVLVVKAWTGEAKTLELI